MDNILIIKLGALGDVIRTTSLLHVLKGNIYWVTREEGLSLLPLKNVNRIIGIDEAECLKREIFDLILCLDDDLEAAALSTRLKKKVLIGSYIDEKGLITYSESSAEWFNMGRISKFGKEKADAIKMANTKTYQEIIFKMIGKSFNGEEYLLNLDGIKSGSKNSRLVVGIESRAGDRWPMKRWNKYNELANLLEKSGYEVRYFHRREHVSDYIQDINDCDLIVCGDTFAMHIALALHKWVVALFICTSPAEIYGYGRMMKIVSPCLNNVFYSREYNFDAVDSISVEDVYSAIKKFTHV